MAFLIAQVVSLTGLLKMVSIPVALVEEAWATRTEIKLKTFSSRQE